MFFINFSLIISSVKDHVQWPPLPSTPTGVPYCGLLLPALPFSMASLDHLPGVQGREELVCDPEPSLLKGLHIRPQQLATVVSEALTQVSTTHQNISCY